MKFTTSAILLTFGAAVTAQDIASLPPCGQVCIGNMLTIATTQFGCKPGDVVCYCTNVNFGYGVRDCSNESCSKEDAAKVIQFGTAYCQAALTGVTTVASNAASGLTVLSSAAVTASPSGTGAAGASGSGAAAASTPVTTSPLVTTIVSDGSTILSTTGFQTIFAPVASGFSSITASAGSAASSIASSAASAASSIASGAESSAESVASSVAASASDVASSAASHASSAIASATGGAASSSSTAGAVPMKTAAPLLGVAAMGALLLI